jgi:hypothetical protein
MFAKLLTFKNNELQQNRGGMAPLNGHFSVMTVSETVTALSWIQASRIKGSTDCTRQASLQPDLFLILK